MSIIFTRLIMATALDSLMVPQPDDYTTSQEYKTYIESLVGFLKDHPSTRNTPIDAKIGYLYRFNLPGLLLEQGVAIEDHLLVMRVNGISSNQEIDETIGSLLIPDESLVARLKQVFRTSLTVS